MLLRGAIVGLAETGSVGVDAAIGIGGACLADATDAERAAAIVLARAVAGVPAERAGTAAVDITLGAIGDPVGAGRNVSTRTGCRIRRRRRLIGAGVLSVMGVSAPLAPLSLLVVFDPRACLPGVVRLGRGQARRCQEAEDGSSQQPEGITARRRGRKGAEHRVKGFGVHR